MNIICQGPVAKVETSVSKDGYGKPLEFFRSSICVVAAPVAFRTGWILKLCHHGKAS